MDAVLIKSNVLHAEYLTGDARSEVNHCHDCYEIMYVISGEGKYILEGSEFALKKRVLLLVRPFAYHSVRADNEAPYEAYIIRFQKSALSGAALSMLERLISEDENGRYFSPDAVSDPLISAFDRFESAAKLPEPERDRAQEAAQQKRESGKKQKKQKIKWMKQLKMIWSK